MNYRCPRCSEALIKSQAGRLKIRLPIIAFRSDGAGGAICETVCPGCKADVALPLVIGSSALAKSLTPPPAPLGPPSVRLTISPPQKTPLTPAPSVP